MSLPYAHSAANFLPHHEAMACPVTGSRGHGLHAALARPGTDKQDWISPAESGWVGLGPAGPGSLERVRVTCTIPAWFQEALRQAPAASVRLGHTRRAQVGSFMRPT
jgi:hypothetical protein